MNIFLQRSAHQLETKGILVTESNGAILDAAIIESSRRPRKVIEVMPEGRKEEETSDLVIAYKGLREYVWRVRGRG